MARRNGQTADHVADPLASSDDPNLTTATAQDPIPAAETIPAPAQDDAEDDEEKPGQPRPPITRAHALRLILGTMARLPTDRDRAAVAAGIAAVMG